MSEREAFAGKALSMSAKVTKCIEADGTSVGRFWVKRSNKTYADQIYQLENREGKTFPAFPVHIRLLGLRQRNGPLVLRFLRPRVSCNISVMFPNPTQTKEDPKFFLLAPHGLLRFACPKAVHRKNLGRRSKIRSSFLL